MRLVDSKRSAIILAFASALALIVLLTFYMHYNMAAHVPQHRFSRQYIEGKNTTVIGKRLSSGRGDFFTDIPYSHPTARFEHSLLLEMPNSTDVWAIHHNLGCPNGYINTNSIREKAINSEVGCRTLNIYRCAQTDQHSLQPVLVYINEGGWLSRSDSNLDPETTVHSLACRGMVIVSVNYRLGFYGFFSSPSHPSKANFALHDIETALKWTVANIAHFGGHPRQITVMAKGLGAQLASILSLSDKNKENALFQRLVLMSGSAFTPTLFESHHNGSNPYDGSGNFAVAANCATEKQWMAYRNNSIQGNEKAAVDQCLLGLSTDAIEVAEAATQVPSFVRWQLTNEKGYSLSGNDSNGAEPNSKQIMMPVLMGRCHRPANKSQPANPTPVEAFTKQRETTLLNAEKLLLEELKKVSDLKQLEGFPSIARHYSGLLKSGSFMDIQDPKVMVTEAMKQIKQEMIEQGPLLLEAMERWLKSNSARIYMFDYEAPWWLNKSQIDVAAIGEEALQTTSDPSLQLPCLDDLLFNPSPQPEWPKLNSTINFKGITQGMIAEAFAQYLANFVTYGDPNIGEEDQSPLPDWPTLSFNNISSVLNSSSIEPIQLLRLNDEQGAVIDELDEISENQRHFWLCLMPKWMNVHSLCLN